MGISDYHTFGEYMKMSGGNLTASMEDYLEMIYRLAGTTGFTRIHELSTSLSVKPSSATKMVQRLATEGFVRYEKYGYIMLEENGKKLGARLLERHTIVESFMRIIGIDEGDVLQETEKMEHTLSIASTKHLQIFIDFVCKNPDILAKFSEFCSQ